MNTFRHALMAGAAALALSSAHALAAEPVPPEPRSSENQPGEGGIVTTAPEVAQQEQEYLAALKKCEPLTGTDKQACLQSAQRTFGRM